LFDSNELAKPLFYQLNWMISTDESFAFKLVNGPCSC